jgi:N-acetylmuramoyl-L-alanine amidase
MWYLLLPWAIFFSSISIEAASTTSLKPFRASIPQHAKPLVILDPGHGGSDEGAKINFFHEKRITLLTTLALKNIWKRRIIGLF